MSPSMYFWNIHSLLLLTLYTPPTKLVVALDSPSDSSNKLPLLLNRNLVIDVIILCQLVLD